MKKKTVRCCCCPSRQRGSKDGCRYGGRTWKGRREEKGILVFLFRGKVVAKFEETEQRVSWNAICAGNLHFFFRLLLQKVSQILILEMWALKERQKIRSKDFSQVKVAALLFNSDKIADLKYHTIVKEGFSHQNTCFVHCTISLLFYFSTFCLPVKWVKNLKNENSSETKIVSNKKNEFFTVLYIYG